MWEGKISGLPPFARISPPIAVCAIVGLALGMLAFGRWNAGECAMDPAGQSHWLQSDLGNADRSSCDPWRFITPPSDLARIKVRYFNYAWGFTSRQLEIDNDGRVALVRYVPDFSDNRKVDGVLLDADLARRLIEMLAPLATHNRVEYTGDKLIEPGPNIYCHSTGYDGGNYTFEVTDTSGGEWLSFVDGDCNSLASSVAEKRIGEAFALAVERTGADSYHGEYYIRPQH